VIKVQARGDASAEILIYEPIGADFFGSGLTARRFIADLERLGDVKDILVRINSPGGEVFDGFAIYNALKNHPAQVHVQIDGLAASIASIIAMSGDLITMGDGAMMMIHNPWTIAIGDSEDMRKTADMLDKVSEGLLDAYESRTGVDRDELKEMLAAETWFTAAEAIEKGFADDRTESEADEPEAIKDRFKKFAADFRAKSANVSPLRIAAMVQRSAPADATTVETQVSKEAPASVQNTDIENAASQAAQAALRAEATRRKAIRDSFGRFSDEHRDLLDECLEDIACTPEAASKKLLAKLGEGAEPLRPTNVVNIADAREKFVTGAQNAILARAGEGKREEGNEFNGMTLADLAGRALALAGVSVKGMSRDAIARRVLSSQTTSDFPSLLSNTAGKVLRNAYGAFPATWNAWCLKGSVSDFKIHPRIQIGSFNNLETIPEGGEYKYGSLAEEYENAQAATKGKAIAFTRQMLVNDDLGAFTRRSQLMGRAAARTVNSDVYTLLTSGSSNHGPTSSDTGQFFNATATTTAGGHANLTDSGTAISTASIALGRKTMRVQKDQSNREVLNILPKFLVCSATKEDIAWAILNSTSDVSQSNPAKKNYAYDVAKLSLVTDPFLDGIGSGLPWYLFADPADVAAFEVVFLDGNETPFIDDMVDFDTDALKFKVRLDYGVALGDWRAAYLNDGA
jgi:ATP-dependent protease ClpP protease subunit